MEVNIIGPTPREGRVEVFYDGEWGTICDDSWDNDDATVFCRMLGYTSGVARTRNEYGQGTGLIWLDEVRCGGDESDLSECGHNTWGDNDCTHYEDAGVICGEYIP